VADVVKSLPETYLEDPGINSPAAIRRKQYMVDLFVRQAKNYDFHDDVYGLYAHRLWVRSVIKLVKNYMEDHEKAYMLDIACGTGFITFNVARKYKNIDIDAFDLSPDMLKVAEERQLKSYKDRQIQFWKSDAEMPFGENKYDIVTVSFAFRNFANKNLVADNVLRALKPGGIFIIQDLTKPEKQPLKGLYLFYMKNLLPIITRILGTEKTAAKWLYKSVIMMPKNAELQELLEQRGFVKCFNKSMSMGIACLVVGYKPEGQ
jgi:demethylmenaquinone methyltransferase/2-methoxy-6-polyprenyl-1,4-benzoquinol methylase